MSMLIAFAAFGQSDVVVEELWNDSKMANGYEDLGDWTDGDAPDWMGASTERGMTHVDGKIYIPSRKDGNQIVVLDALTGNHLTTIDLPATVDGGLFPLNSISRTASGDLVLGNLSADTKAVDADTGEPSDPFKAYHIELNASGDDVENVTTIIDWNNADAGEEEPSYRIGDGIAFYGDIADGESGYLITANAGSNFVLRWDVVDGAFDAEPTVFQAKDSNPSPEEGSDVNLGTSPQCFPIDDDLVIIDGKDLFPAVYDMDGNMVTTFGETTPIQGGGNGVGHFMLDQRSFVVASSTIWTLYPEGSPENAFQLFELVDDQFQQADSIAMLPEEGLSSSGENNVTFTYPVAVDVVNDEAFIYVMAPNSGIAGFKVTIDESTGMPQTKASAVTVYPNPATDVVNFSEEMASVKIYDMSGKFVREVTNTSQINVSNLSGMYLLNAVDKQGNAVRKTIMIK